jgi:hypothetical protein
MLSVIDEETGLRVDISTDKYKHINIDGKYFEEIIILMKHLLTDVKEHSELLGKKEDGIKLSANPWKYNIPCDSYTTSNSDNFYFDTGLGSDLKIYASEEGINITS